jgi:hypothetical protein
MQITCPNMAGLNHLEPAFPVRQLHTEYSNSIIQCCLGSIAQIQAGVVITVFPVSEPIS